MEQDVEMDFIKLSVLTHSVQMETEEILDQFMTGKITMREYEELYDELQDKLNAAHYRYIAKKKLIEKIPDYSKLDVTTLLICQN